jgi:hypothetical protein
MAFAGEPLPFSWTYTKVRNFETCPKRYFHYDLQKDTREPETEQLIAGNELHKAFELRIKKGEELPLGMTQYEGLLASIIAAPGKTYGEQKLAITSNFTPVAFFGKGAWLRVIIDCAKVDGDSAKVFDWKTGRPSDDITQLQITAAVLFHHLPAVQRVRAAFVFVNHDKIEKAEFLREDLTEIWSEVLPRVKAIERARQEMNFPPKPSGLCKKYCAVTHCPFHGKGG